jgi:hypothetical protein
MIPTVRFLLNDREQTLSRSRGTVLLDVLRDDLGLTGTKDACREGDCSARRGPRASSIGPSTPASSPWAKPRAATW